MSWTPTADARLAELWLTDRSLREIAAILREEGLADKTRSAVGSHGNRLGLKRREWGSHKARYQVPMSNGTLKGCQWIDKEGPPFKGTPKCGKETVPGRSWCGEHAARVYQ